MNSLAFHGRSVNGGSRAGGSWSGGARAIRAAAACLLMALSASAPGATLLDYYTFNGNYNDSAGGRTLTGAVAGTGGTAPQLIAGAVADGAGTTRTNIVRLAGGATNFRYLSWTGTSFQPAQFTAMVWAKTSNATQGSNRGIFSNGVSSTTHFQIDLNAGETYGAVVANQWTHLCETWDGTATTLYADGVRITSAAGNAGNVFDRLSIGVNRNLGTAFTGDVDDFGLFNAALDAQRIAVIHALGLFHGRNLDSADIDTFLNAFLAGPGHTATLDGSDWTYAPASVLNAGTTIGVTGGSVAGNSAYVVLDSAGNGMMIAAAPSFIPANGGNVSLAVGGTHANVVLGLAVNPAGDPTRLDVQTSDPSPLVLQNLRIWGSGTVMADVATDGPGVVVGTTVPLLVTVSNGLLPGSDTVTIHVVAQPNSPPVFQSTGTFHGDIGQTTVAPAMATVRDEDDPTTVCVAYAPSGVRARVCSWTQIDPQTIAVDLEAQIDPLVAAGTYPIRLMASDGHSAAIGTVALIARGEPAVGTPGGDAQAILQATGVTGGLIVHLGCGDGQLTAALADYSTCVVQGLDQDPAKVALARNHIDSLGLYGRATAELWSGPGLPFIDNMVNLIVAQDLVGVDMDELMRVLAPNGKAYLKQAGAWHAYVKPRPGWIDEWTHILHDPSNNTVAQDDAIRFPKRFQWIADPKWSSHHDHKSAVNGMVSANGRIFSFIDEGERRSIVLPARLELSARDAFNGALLWTRPFDTWHVRLWPLKSGPAQLARRLVANGDRVYVTLGTNQPVSCLDAATGQTIRVYNQTRTAEEILYYNGTLYISVNDAPTSKTYSTLAQVTADADTAWWSGQTRWITAVDAETGALKWRVQRPVAPMSLAASDRGVFFYDGTKVVRLSPTDGSQVWQSDPLPCKATILSEDGPRITLYQDVVFYTGDETGSTDTEYALSADTGATLWSGAHPQTGHHCPQDLMVVDGLVWANATAQGADSGQFTGRDPWTGTIMAQFLPDISTYWFHHRCYPAKATKNYLLMSRTGIEFIDPTTGHWTAHHWIRGTCIEGIMPCNGLIYTPPHNCACYAEAKLYGYCATAPDDNGTTINRGPNLALNADFESGDAPWQFLPAGSGHATRYRTDSSGYVALLTAGADDEAGHLRQDVALAAGKRYQVAFDLPYWGQQPNLTNQFLVDLSGAVQALEGSSGHVEATITAGAGGYIDISPVGDSDLIALVDNVSVREMVTLSDPVPPVGPESEVAASASNDERLVLGPAYGQGAPAQRESQSAEEWPTYRHDTARSGAASSVIGEALQPDWHTRLNGRLSSPVIADDKVFLASIDAHAVYALRASDGLVLWKYVAGGRVDSPPTFDSGNLYFGSNDGWVYCLRAADGQLVWRYRAAPTDRQMMAYDQLESVWPVPGSVLVFGGSVYCVAGRSMFLDGGIHFLRLDAQTGQQQCEMVLDDIDPVSGKNLQTYVTGLNMTVALPDILSYDGRYVYMRSMPFDTNGVRQHIAYRVVTDQIGQYTHLFAPYGFLGDPWMHRIYWVYGQSYASGAGGYSQAGQNAPSGQILTNNATAVYGIGRKPEYYKWTTPMEFCLFRAPIPWTAGGTPKTFSTDWSVAAPTYARAMVLTTDTLFLAGPRDVLDEEAYCVNLADPVLQAQALEQEAALNGQTGALLTVVRTADGATRGQIPLDYPTVWDGMAAAYGCLFVSTMDGQVMRIQSNPSSRVDSWRLY
ncbi:MAG: PQQ-binding-like beta-propeller repeat protein [Candidatus Sumerlaeota bacterium]|nr:PQQ-binding-like beta-propeller repeat protein [Candidatus Sumerlaeota bacterium]